MEIARKYPLRFGSFMPYLAIGRVTFLSALAFRWFVLLDIVRGALRLFVYVALWSALLEGRESPGGITLSQTVTYFVLGVVLAEVNRAGAGAAVGDAIVSGQIATELWKPLRTLWIYIAQSLGGTAANLATRAIPMAIVFIAIFTPEPPASAGAFLACLALGAMGFVLSMLTGILIGLAAFWTLSSWYLPWFQRALTILFGGVVVPIWFYPSWLERITEYLPFRFVHFVPLAVYLGEIPMEEVPILMVVACIWIAALAAAVVWVWRTGMKRIVIQGG